MHNSFDDKPLALAGLKTFFMDTAHRLPNEKYLEELASFLPNDFFSDHKTLAERWNIIKNNCKNPAFKKVIYSEWRVSPFFLLRMANFAQANADLVTMGVFNKLNYYNHVRHLILPDATNNRMPLLKQQAIVLVTIKCFCKSKYIEESLDQEMEEVDMQDQFTDQNIIDYYHLNKESIHQQAQTEHKDMLLNKQPAPISMLNAYLNPKKYDDNHEQARKAPVVQTSLLQWRCVVPIVCTLAATAMITYFSTNKPT